MELVYLVNGNESGGGGGSGGEAPAGYKLVKAVKLTSLTKSTRPSIDSSHGVGRGVLTLEIAIVVAGNRSVSSLVLVISIGRNENRRHHSKRTECG